MKKNVNLTTGLPQLNNPADPNEIGGLVGRVTEFLRRWNGEGADPKERVITVGEAEQALGHLGIGIGGDGRLFNPTTGGANHKAVTAPTGLSVLGGFETVILSWSGTDQKDYSYTEIWRAESDNLSIATLRGRTPAAVFNDDARADKTYYYWIRFVSTSGAASPFNDTAGTVAQTSLDPGKVRDQITSNDWQASTSYRLFEVVAPRDGSGDFYTNANGVPLSYQVTAAGTTGGSEPTWPTTLGNTVADGGVTWQAIDAGKAPLVVGTRNGDPVVVMPGVFIEDASIVTAKIKDAIITTAKIADAAITTAKIASAQITEALIATAAITTAKIASAAITTAKIANLAVTTAKIDTLSVTNAKIANLAVDTIKIANQAVTIPSSAYTAGDLAISSTSSYVTVESASLTSTGAPIFVHGSLQIQPTTSDTLVYDYRVTRNGSTVYGPIRCGNTSRGGGIDGPNTVGFGFSDQPGSGTYTYRVQLNFHDASADVSERSIMLLETKK